MGGVQRSFDASAVSSVSIGRDLAHPVVVDHNLVSRFHAQVQWRYGWQLTDAGSTNGTFIGGMRVVRAVRVDRPLEIRLGDPHTGPLLTLAPSPRASRRPSRLGGSSRPSPGVNAGCFLPTAATSCS